MVNDVMRDVYAGWAESKSRPRVIVTGSAAVSRLSLTINNSGMMAECFQTSVEVVEVL